MVLFAIASHIAPRALVGIFTNDPAVIAVGEEYLRIVSWNYVASGLVFVASSMFQAMGNTLPSLISSGVRVVLIVVPALMLSRLPGFQLRTIGTWRLARSWLLARAEHAAAFREFRRRLKFAAPHAKAA
jgi:Na+-driven multidrug efflux pump